MKIYYCDQCEKRVPEEELDSGHAVIDADDKAFCAACVVAMGGKQFAGRKAPPRNPRQTPAVGVRHTGFATTVAKAAHSHTPAHSERLHLSSPVSRKNLLPHLALGAAAVAILFGVSYVFKSSSHTTSPPPALPTAANSSVPKAGEGSLPSATAPAAPATLTPAPSTVAQPGGVFAEVMREHEREADPDRQKTLAVSKLAAAREFAAKNPQDPWHAVELYEAVPVGTPSGAEAVQTLMALRPKLPAAKAGTPGWYREWTVENRSNDESVSMLYNFDGRANILKTIPPGKDAELFLLRRLAVPASPAQLTFSARGADKGECQFALEINGKLQLLDNLNKTWKNFELNLNELAGQTVDVKIRHIATGWDDESAFWTEPAWSGSTKPGAHAATYNPKAPEYGPLWALAMRRAEKRPYIARIEWADDERWMRALNLLALADVKKGARESEWKRLESGAILSGKNKAKANGARLEIDFTCPAEYDIRAVFERKNGNYDAAFLLPHPASGGNFCWCLGAAENRYAAITEVGGKRFEGPVSLNVGKVLENNRKYTTVVEVRKDRISAYLEGRLLVEWTPDMGPLKAQDAWKLHDQSHPGLASWNTEVLFYSFELVGLK